jgi:hypothetical protein
MAHGGRDSGLNMDGGTEFKSVGTELGRERTQRWEEGGRRQGARQAVEPGQVAAVVYR